MIISPKNIEKWCFDYFEGNLTAAEKITFEKFILEHPEFHEEFQAWKDASAEADDDDKLPLYGAASGLLVNIPFYTTLTFRIAVASITVLSLITLGTYLSRQEVPNYRMAKFTGIDVLNGDKLGMDVVRYVDFAYGSHHITNSNTPNYNYLSSSDNSSNQSELISNNANTVAQITFTDYAFGNYQLGENSDELDNGDELAMVSLQDEITYLNSVSEFQDSVHHDDKSVLDHMGIKTNKYQFLNFNNSKVHGIGYDQNKKGVKKNGNDNHANIVQNSDKNGGSNGGNKKAKLMNGWKNIQLGLSNINDPIIVMPNNNIVGVNPALAGQLGVTRLKSNIRAQWWGSDRVVFMGSSILDTYIDKIQAGVALSTNYFYGENGALSASSYGFTYSQKVNLSKAANLSIGLTYDIAKSLNNTSISQQVELFHNNSVLLSSVNANSNKWKSNLGISSWYSGKYFYGGLTVTNLLGNSFTASHEGSSTYVNNVDYSVQLGTDYKRSFLSKTVVSPFISYQKLGELKELWMGATLRYRSLVLGSGIASNKSIKALIGIQGNKIRLTLGSDYMKSEVLGQYALSHEVSFRLLFGTKQNNWSRYEH
ncbi:MAG: type IX secretion system membrane protein PorP/SprF [Flavobacteriales bacterium]|nr:type IX secretion system membrane protein PorP/SprF [Flavobacteriales bacterium]